MSTPPSAILRCRLRSQKLQIQESDEEDDNGPKNATTEINSPEAGSD
jgi:hypothetical protein